MVILKKIIHVLSIITYILTIIYAMVCIPMIFGYHPVVVLSGSMEPTYKTGSIIYYKKIELKNLKEKDVITYETKNKTFVSHRIVSIDGDFIETKGDANDVPDVNKVHYENVKGKVAEISLPYIGNYIRIVNDNITIAVIIAVVILISEFLISNKETFNISKKNESSEENEKN